MSLARARLLALGTVLTACARPSGAPQASTAPVRVEAAPSDVLRPGAAARPRVVLAVVVDQLASTEFLRVEPHLNPEGMLRRMAREGAFYERARYPQAATLTAPGHVGLFTGAPPAESGVSGNELWDRASKSARPATYDASATRSFSQEPLGPGALRAETVAEVLQRESGGRAKILALSLKDRGAVFSLGRAGLALFYESSTGSFVSSTAYARDLPEWLERFRAAHPIGELVRPWRPLDAELYARVQSADDRPYEVLLPGFGRAFPHDPSQHPEPLAVLKFTPQLGDRLFAMALAAVDAEGFGADEVPDLLVLSISGLDYAGHLFGPRSWEYLDHLLRIDRALTELVHVLAARVNLVVMVSSDHGVAPIPEGLAELPDLKHVHGGRVFTKDLAAGLEEVLQKSVGPGPWVDAVLGAHVYLTTAARTGPEFPRVLTIAKKWLEERHGLSRAFVVQELRGRAATLRDPLERAVALSLGNDLSAELYLVQQPYFVFDGGTRPGAGTHHGSPYDYDREVPIFVWGAGIAPRRVAEPVDALGFASTLSHVLGVENPAQASAQALPFAPPAGEGREPAAR